MRSSFYNHYISIGTRTFLYNLLTTALVELENGITAENVVNRNVQLIPAFTKMGFLVDDELEEWKLYELYFNKARYGASEKIFALTLLPTYACNLACPYCYQGQEKNALHMGKEGVNRVLSFIRKNVTMENKINASLYGGEPLVDKEAVVCFVNGVNDIATEKGIAADYSMTTNLTLLDNEIIHLIGKYRIELQVTIDGTMKIHDKRRCYRDGSGSYKRIIENLKLLKFSGLSDLVNIRMNVDNESIDLAEQTFSAVKDLAGNHYFSLIVRHNHANDCHERLCVSEEHFSEFVARTNIILQQAGKAVHRSFGKRVPCTLFTPNRYFIDSHFDVYGCDCLVNHPECKIGIIDEDGNLNFTNQYYRQMGLSPFSNEKCRHCKWLPACGGGCPARKYVNSLQKDGRLDFQCIVDEKTINNYIVDYIQRIYQDIETKI